jgi:hypothetical protein
MENLQDEKDKMLWKQAKKRVGFRNHLYIYLIINIFFWAMWWFGGKEDREGGIPWPTFCTLGWGFGIFWHFMGAYVFSDKTSQVEKEFRRLKERSGSN